MHEAGGGLFIYFSISISFLCLLFPHWKLFRWEQVVLEIVAAQRVSAPFNFAPARFFPDSARVEWDIATFRHWVRRALLGIAGIALLCFSPRKKKRRKKCEAKGQKHPNETTWFVRRRVSGLQRVGNLSEFAILQNVYRMQNVFVFFFCCVSLGFELCSCWHFGEIFKWQFSCVLGFFTCVECKLLTCVTKPQKLFQIFSLSLRKILKIIYIRTYSTITNYNHHWI